jgi:hypothetical protein
MKEVRMYILSYLTIWLSSWFLCFFVSGHCVEIYVVFLLSQTLARVAFLQVLVSGYTPYKFACNQQAHGGGMKTYESITRWLPGHMVIIIMLIEVEVQTKALYWLASNAKEFSLHEKNNVSYFLKT